MEVPTITTNVNLMDSPVVSENQWSGNYLYFGEENGVPVKWRVLDKTGSGGNSSVSGGILLQADQPVGETASYADAYEWISSDEDGFLKDFTLLEQQAILESTSTVKVDAPTSLLSTAALTGEKVFLLDAADLATEAYGYRYSKGISNTGIEASPLWWLRSGYYMSDKGAQGCVLPGNVLFYSFDDADGQIVPALNIDKSKILFLSDPAFGKSQNLSEVSASQHTDWKLTLLDSAISVNIEDAEAVTRNGSSITVSYTLTGRTELVNQLSVMITQGNYENGNILYYGKVTDNNGKVTFTLPDGFNESNHKVYLVAENTADSQKTDYAGVPAEITIPPLHVHSWASAWSYDKEMHWHECVSNLPGCDVTSNAQKNGYAEHDLEEYVIKEATCTTEGSECEHCTVCGYSTEPEETEPLDHEADEDDEGIVIKAPTCEEEGLARYTCILCHQIFDEELEPLEHQVSSWKVVKPATFLEEGLQVGTCIVCYEEVEEEIPAGIEDHEHEYTVKKQAATCEQGGKEIYTCTESQCGDSYIANETPALGHRWGSWKTKTAATETKKGVKQRVCSRCGKMDKADIPVSAHKHKYDESQWMYSDSGHWQICSCGKKGNASSHNWKKGIIVIQPTKQQEGQINYVCRQCGYSTICFLPAINTKFTFGKYQYQFTGIKKGIPVATLLGFAKGKTAKTGSGAIMTVTKVGNHAFIRRKTIKKIIISDTVEEIGNLAFFGNSNVTKVKLGKGVKKIGSHSFCRLKKLKQFVIQSKQLKKIIRLIIFIEWILSKSMCRRRSKKNIKKCIRNMTTR